MKKIYYLAYYGDRDTENCRNSHPAAELQVLYLVQVLNELGYEVEIVSPSGVGKVKKFLMYSREYTWQIKKVSGFDIFQVLVQDLKSYRFFADIG